MVNRGGRRENSIIFFQLLRPRFQIPVALSSFHSFFSLFTQSLSHSVTHHSSLITHSLSHLLPSSLSPSLSPSLSRPSLTHSLPPATTPLSPSLLFLSLTSSPPSSRFSRPPSPRAWRQRNANKKRLLFRQTFGGKLFEFFFRLWLCLCAAGCFRFCSEARPRLVLLLLLPSSLPPRRRRGGLQI